jgi:aerobic-type carbon monoxide dehydrogenase small subunit (CoxS/CutS family)
MEISFELNEQKVQVNVPPHLRLSVLLSQQQGNTILQHQCARGACGCCLVLVNNQLLHSCLLMSYDVRGAQVQTAQHWHHSLLMRYFLWAQGVHHLSFCPRCTDARLLSLAYLEANPNSLSLKECLVMVSCPCMSYEHGHKIFAFVQKLQVRNAK